jgi:hypothetical protein
MPRRHCDDKPHWGVNCQSAALETSHIKYNMVAVLIASTSDDGDGQSLAAHVNMVDCLRNLHCSIILWVMKLGLSFWGRNIWMVFESSTQDHYNFFSLNIIPLMKSRRIRWVEQHILKFTLRLISISVCHQQMATVYGCCLWPKNAFYLYVPKKV